MKDEGLYVNGCRDHFSPQINLISFLFQDNSNPGCNVVKQAGLAIMECRDYCKEEGCNKGGRDKMPVMIQLVVLVTFVMIC